MSFSLYFHTLRHVKPVQIWYQVYYRLKGKLVRFSQPKTIPQSSPVEMQSFIPSYVSYLRNGKFEFLNQVHVFDNIDWNFNKNGKLWTYNLNYFEFLNQPDSSKEEGWRLINDFISQNQTHKDAYEPYPISLRIISWVKFLSRFGIREDAIDRQLYSDCVRLSKCLEYHLLANHLLENGFGLLFGAYYFKDERLYRKAETIIRKELKEQTLSDGAHYELSPMYHQIILSRVLDSYNLVCSNDWKQSELQPILLDTAQKMLSWLDNITFQSGEIPMVNDATRGIAPTTKELVEYARRLTVSRKKIPLGESGYRMYKDNVFELLCDAGQIAPSYQPGHSHADNLNFLVQVLNRPVITDTGISTYEKNEQRQKERSTAAHNTLQIDGRDSSQVWSGFRVGKRAVTTILSESNHTVTASHNGYRNLKTQHKRSFTLNAEGIQITDEVVGVKNSHRVNGYLHFHPDCQVKIYGSDSIIVNNDIAVTISGCGELHLETYHFAAGFNKRKSAIRAVYTLESNISTINIKLKA